MNRDQAVVPQLIETSRCRSVAVSRTWIEAPAILPRLNRGLCLESAPNE